MNNKLTISVLVVLIVIIWGTIAFRIKSYTPVKSTILPVSESLEMDTVLHVEKLYTLRGDYPDPFLGGHEKKSSLGLVVVKEKRKIIWPDLTYKGCVAGKSRLAIVIKNDRTIFMRRGEIIDDIILERVEEDFIVLKKQGERNIIRISKLSEEIP